MLLDQANQTSGQVQYVHDASADPTVVNGSAWYEFDGTTNALLSDYTKRGQFQKSRFIWIESELCLIKKVGDLVYEKDVDYNGNTVTLNGWTYDGGGTGLIANYTKTKSYA